MHSSISADSSSFFFYCFNLTNETTTLVEQPSHSFVYLAQDRRIIIDIKHLAHIQAYNYRNSRPTNKHMLEKAKIDNQGRKIKISLRIHLFGFDKLSHAPTFDAM